MQSKPWIYSGPPYEDAFGHVETGGVAYFAGRPPSDDWSPWTPPILAPVEAPTAVPAEASGETDAGELRQPNKAASADDWRLYADQHGGFEEATGKSPLDPATTRKEIVDHYTAAEGEQS